MFKFFLIAFLISLNAFADVKTCRSVLDLRPLATPEQRFDTPSVKSNWFVTSRGLPEYQHALSDHFTQALHELRGDEVWIDFGAGKALAAEDYLLQPSSREKASVFAITYKYGRWFPKYKGPKLQIQKGKFLEELMALPEFKLGSDVMGIFSYTQHLDYYFQISLKHLQVGGKLFIDGALFKTSIRLKNGNVVSVFEWLKSVPGIQVELYRHGPLIITKINEEIEIPKLKILKINEDLPPSRSFAED